MKKSKKMETIEQVTLPKAVVTFGLGATLNAGDFESVKVNFSLSLECPSNEIQKTIKKVKAEVKKQLKEEITELKGLIGK